MDRYFAISFVVFFLGLIGLAALLYEDIKAYSDVKVAKVGTGTKDASPSDEEVFYVYIQPIDFAVSLNDGRLSRYNIEPTIEVYNKVDQELVENQKPRIVDTFIQVLYNRSVMIDVIVNGELDLSRLMSVLQEKVTMKLFPNQRSRVLIRALEKGHGHGSGGKSKGKD